MGEKRITLSDVSPHPLLSHIHPLESHSVVSAQLFLAVCHTALASLPPSTHRHLRMALLPCGHVISSREDMTGIFQLKFRREKISFNLLPPRHLVQTGLLRYSRDLKWIETRTILLLFFCMLEIFNYLHHEFF